MNGNKRTSGIVIIILGLLLILGGVAGLIFYMHSEPKIDNAGKTDISASTPSPTVISTPEPEPSSEPVESPEQTIEPTPTPMPLVENPYKEFFLENEDMEGWLFVPDTKINDPVMWTPGDEEYYLYRGFDKKKNANGCLILDTDSSMNPLSTNLIIHGHDMKSGAMFGWLDKYKDEEYCKEHNTIYLYGKDYEHRYEVIAVFYSQVFRKSDTCFKYYKFFNADTEEEFLDFYNNIKEMSLYDTGVTASFGDHFITLSTCSYQVENGRFVVVGREIESGDYYLAFDE